MILPSTAWTASVTLQTTIYKNMKTNDWVKNFCCLNIPNWQSYLSAEMQLVYSTTPANWATGHSLGESYPSAKIAVGVFYSTNWMGLMVLGQFFLSFFRENKESVKV